MKFKEFLDLVSPKENVSSFIEEDYLSDVLTSANAFEQSSTTIAEEASQSSNELLAQIERNISNPKADISWWDLVD